MELGAKWRLQKDTCEVEGDRWVAGLGDETPKQIVLENTIMMPNTLYANSKKDKWPERNVGVIPSTVSVLGLPSLPYSWLFGNGFGLVDAWSLPWIPLWSWIILILNSLLNILSVWSVIETFLCFGIYLFKFSLINWNEAIIWVWRRVWCCQRDLPFVLLGLNSKTVEGFSYVFSVRVKPRVSLHHGSCKTAPRVFEDSS